MGLKTFILLFIISISTLITAQVNSYELELPEENFSNFITIQFVDSTIPKEYLYSYSAGRTLVEIAAGAALGSIGTIAGGFIGAKLTSRKGESFSGMVGGFIGGYTGFLIGTAGGVTLVSHNYNSDASFMVPFLASIGGGVAGILLADWDGKGNWRQALPFILPLVSSITVAEIIYPSRIEINVDRNQAILNHLSPEFRVSLSIPLNR